MIILFKLVAIFLMTLVMMHYAILYAGKKKWYQPIYELSPSRHQKKAFTPAIGGVIVVLCIIIGSGICGLWFHVEIQWLIGILVLFALIGAGDDIVAMILNRNQGLTAKQKFSLQLGCSMLSIGYWMYMHPGDMTIWSFLFFSIVMTGASNATNLTDGLDGLLGGCMVISLIGTFLIAWPLVVSNILLMIGIIVVVLLGFLIFNIHPACVFMGDSGSLSLGALLTGICIIVGDIWILMPLGVVYIVETLSVMIQVIWFKKTKSRVFLMAPLHHHFEKLGMKETHVVGVFWILGVLGVLVGVLGMSSR
jgi:phospho-N-acetylmuramoyl-pentapeptide-transferase